LASTVKEQAEGKKDDETVNGPGPTIFARCDNSKIGALTVLENNVPADELEKRKSSRLAIINVLETSCPACHSGAPLRYWTPASWTRKILSV
jgi:hypothetical protein